MLLNNQQIIEEIKKEIKLCIETHANENTSKNLWDTLKAEQGSQQYRLTSRYTKKII